MKKSLIIADDFTGANDTGLQLKRKGYQTKVVFHYPVEGKNNISYVIDTETRNLSPDHASVKLKSAISGVNYDDFHYVIKKIDSTLRGNISEELKIVDKRYGSELILVIPALPDMGRTTIGGVQLLNEIPLTQTELAKDPKKPVREDDVRKLLSTEFQEEIYHIALDEIRNDTVDFTKGRVYVCDVQNNGDMLKVLQEVVRLEKRTLYVGTAALAEFLLEIVEETKPAMALIASISSVTRKQVLYAEEKGTAVVQVPIYELLRGTLSDKYVDLAVEYLKKGTDVMLLSSATYDRQEYDKTIEVGKRRGLTTVEISNYTQICMGAIGKQIMDKVSIAGVFLTGGDTAISLFEQLEADGSEVIQEVSITLPLLRLTGGDYEGLKVITKAGAFGNVDTISYGLRKLKEDL